MTRPSAVDEARADHGPPLRRQLQSGFYCDRRVALVTPRAKSVRLAGGGAAFFAWGLALFGALLARFFGFGLFLAAGEFHDRHRGRVADTDAVLDHPRIGP